MWLSAINSSISSRNPLESSRPRGSTMLLACCFFLGRLRPFSFARVMVVWDCKMQIVDSCCLRQTAHSSRIALFPLFSRLGARSRLNSFPRFAKFHWYPQWSYSVPIHRIAYIRDRRSSHAIVIVFGLAAVYARPSGADRPLSQSSVEVFTSTDWLRRWEALNWLWW